MPAEKPPTHVAYTLKRESRTDVCWLEIGVARIEKENGRAHQVYLDRLPIGGFTGRIHLSPVGVKPALPEPQPLRPAGSCQDEELD